MFKKPLIFVVSLIFFSFLAGHAFSATTGNSWERYDRLLRIREQINTLRLNKSRVKVIATPTQTVTLNLKPTVTPTPTTTFSSVTDVQTYIMNEINKYRASAGLPYVQTSNETCNFAKVRAEEISINFNHDGFNNRVNNHTLPYATWSKITENLAMTSSYKNVVSMWANSSGHAANMRADTPFVCVAQYGNYYAYEGMKP